MNWTMELFTWVNGPRMDYVMARGCRFGRMGLSMKVTGRTIWLMEKEDLFTQTEMYMKEIGLMIKLMDEEFIFIWMELNIKVIGEKTNNMVTV